MALTRFAVIGLLLGAPAATLGADLMLSSNEESVIAMADGTPLWEVRVSPSVLNEVVSWDGTRAVLASGWVIDREGRIVARLADAGATWRAVTTQGPRNATWDPLFQLVPPPVQADAHQPPFFDSEGDAWVINTHIAGGNYSLQVRESNGHTGTWGPLDTISNSTNYVAGPEGTIDDNDVITVAFRDISGGYKLYIMRYTPGSGWVGPTLIHTTSSFFQAIEIGADSAGNVAVVFDQSSRVYTKIYDAAAGTWGPATQISPGTASCILPTVLRNEPGDAMFVVYGAGGQLYGHVWDEVTTSWGPAEVLPGTSNFSYSGAGPVSRLPGVVDDNGSATVFWGDPYVPHASRYENSAWQAAVPLLGTGIVDVENFGGATVSPSGDVLGVFSKFDSGSVFYAFQYEPGTGWLPPATPHAFNLNIATRVRAAFYQGRKAVATMLGEKQGIQQIVSFLYDGSAWQGGLVDIPQEEKAFYQDLAADAGEVLLVYEGEVSTVNQGIKATWFRDSLAGDLNCDGALNAADIDPFVLALTDPAAYANQHPNCDAALADVNGDGAVNAADIDPFVILLTGP